MDQAALRDIHAELLFWPQGNLGLRKGNLRVVEGARYL